MDPAIRRIRPNPARRGSSTRRIPAGAALLCCAAALLPGAPAAVAAPDGAAAAGGDRWSPPQQVSGKGRFGTAVIAGSDSGRRLTVLWHGRPAGAGDYTLQSASSKDHGSTWTRPTRVSRPPRQGDPLVNGARLASSRDGRRVVALWTETGRRPADSHAYAAASANGGRTWTAPRRLSTDAGRARGPHTALVVSRDGRRVAAVWRQRSGKRGTLMAARSRNGGVRWGSPRPLVNGIGLAGPQLAASADTDSLVLAWVQRKAGLSQIHVAHARKGLRWDPPSVISRGAADPSETDAQDGAWEPRAVSSADGRRVSVLWRETVPGSFDDVIAAASSGDGGTTWTPRQLLFTEGFGDYPSLAGSADGSVLVAAWEGYLRQPPLGYGAFAAVSRDAGLTWGPAQTVAPGSEKQSTGAVSSADGTAQAITWRSSPPIRVSRSIDSGATWGSATSLSQGRAFEPRLFSSADGLRLTAVWEQTRSQTIWTSSLDLRPAAQ